MGPRFDERGNALDLATQHGSHTLASMGPRFDERGNDQFVRAFGHVFITHASMGPRFDERGNHTDNWKVAASLGSFNGAALR